jgi:hypothetical protein
VCVSSRLAGCEHVSEIGGMTTHTCAACFGSLKAEELPDLNWERDDPDFFCCWSCCVVYREQATPQAWLDLIKSSSARRALRAFRDTHAQNDYELWVKLSEALIVMEREQRRRMIRFRLVENDRDLDDKIRDWERRSRSSNPDLS